jgi:hypothetical protein
MMQKTGVLKSSASMTSLGDEMVGNCVITENHPHLTGLSILHVDFNLCRKQQGTILEQPAAL